MNIDTLTIAEASEAVATGKKVEEALGSKPSPSPDKGSNEGLNIVILDRGFVYVGDVTVSEGWLVISDARNIRRWGTTQGLGELALNGPQPETKLDMGGTIKAPMHAVIGLLKCEVSKWK